jgi:hypothetical protein
MRGSQLIEALGYGASASFASARKLDDVSQHSHVFRRAVHACKLHGGQFMGVYQLRGADSTDAPATPVVYTAEAPSFAAADEIHRKVWNQNAVPFLLVRIPDGVRLYSGFRYEPASGPRDQQQGVLEVCVAFDDVLSKLSEFHARSIDDGSLWRTRARDIDPSTRVDWRLLANLEGLGKWLRSNGLDTAVAHALIGKFVYLRYLRDRDILSDRRLEELGVDLRQVFGRHANADAFERLCNRVDEWLNGSVFPFPFSGRRAPTREHVQEVAGVFLGDDPTSGQLHLDFRAYDFSYIPIETLSVIYEQFLAAEDLNHTTGAFYTPIPVVNFMLGELDDLRELRPGMRLLDPSCGSGAFLVQCYRRLVERHIFEQRRRPRPSELRDLLVRHVFGIDRDGDACRVTELSLVLTMLDYIDPPDLLRTPSFKLPDLHNQNIFEADFFDQQAGWNAIIEDGFDWIIGNPPWVKLTPGRVDDADRPALRWIEAHANSEPVAALQIAEAFAWKSLSVSARDGVLALLLPAMTLFREDESFRRAFFSRADVPTVANLTNLREVLFGGRARDPAAAFFFRPATKQRSEDVLVYSPLVANQEATRPAAPGSRIETWTITVNRSEIHALPMREAATGSGLPWKVAMWGTVRDKRLLEGVARRFSTLEDFAKKHGLVIGEGLQLRSRHESSESVEAVPEVVGKLELDVKQLRAQGHIHAFPSGALRVVDEGRAFARKRGGIEGPLRVCRPPHVVVAATRSFAVFSDQFLVVPARQVGIAGPPAARQLLQVLALYLSSDFVAYHQFFDSTQGFVRNGLSTLASLRRMPVPALDELNLKAWITLHQQLVQATESVQNPEESQRVIDLERELNSLVGEALGLAETDRWLIDDFVHVRMELTDGRIGLAATGRPSKTDLESYGAALGDELDAFLDPALELVHTITIVPETSSGVVEIEVGPRGRKRRAVIVEDIAIGDRLRSIRARLDETHRQWLYFDRNLFLYAPRAAYVFKPMQRMLWTRSQALADADELIAEALVTVKP